MARTLAEIDAEIAAMQTRLRKLSDPDRAVTLKHNGREMSRSAGGADLTMECRRQLRELQAERARVAGTRSPVSPVRT